MNRNNKSTMETLGDYMKGIFDTNNDGVVNFKDLFEVFPSKAVGIVILFVDVLMLVAEFRVWDFGMVITNHNKWKAIGFVAISSIPFYLGQIMWLYQLATGFQKAIAVAYISGGLWASWTFGTADLTQQYDLKGIVQDMNYLIVGYIVLALIYVVIDPHIKALRKKTQAERKAEFQGELNNIAEGVLGKLERTLEKKRDLESRYGQAEVERALAALTGITPNSQTTQAQRATPKPLPPPAGPHIYTLAEYLNILGYTEDQARDTLAQYNLPVREAWDFLKKHDWIPQDMVYDNFKSIYGELMEPVVANRNNHRANP